jgi:hypothetical protein
MTTNRDAALNTVYPSRAHAEGWAFRLRYAGMITYDEYNSLLYPCLYAGWMIKLGPDVPFHATSAPD